MLSLFSRPVGAAKGVESGRTPLDGILEGVPYIDQLHDDHLLVLDCFHEIEVALQQRRFAKLAQLVRRFGQEYQNHTLREHRLLVTLDRQCRDDPETFCQLREDRRLRDQSIRDVQGFVDQFGGSGVRRDSAMEFTLLLASMGGLVVRQLEREEQGLFGIYRACCC